MPTDGALQHGRPVTRSELLRGLRALGVRPSGVLMVHTRMSTIGWVVGGSQTVVEALLAAVGPGGTLMAYAGWEDDPWHLAEWPPEWQRAYRAELPPFDPDLSEADHEMGRLPERIRTWPGAKASTGHVMRMVAVGARAGWLTRDQPLMLGAPLDTLTLLHYAESLVDGPGKRMVTYALPIRDGEKVTWREVRDYDTSSRGAFPYEHVIPRGDDAFAVIGRLALTAGAGVIGQVGDAESHLFAARPLVNFSVAWLQQHFDGGPAV